MIHDKRGIKRGSKRGEFDVVVTMIIIVICAILLIVVITAWGKQVGLKQHAEICRMSILAQQATELGPADSPLSISCEKRYITFYNNKVEAGIRPDNKDPIDVFYNGKRTKKFSGLNDYIVNQVIAEEMRICYYEMGEAQTEIFPNDEDFIGYLFFQYDDDVCFVCSEITFDKSVGSKNFVGLYTYLNETFLNNENMTYIGYLDKPSLSDESWLEYTWNNPDATLKRLYTDPATKIYDPIRNMGVESSRPYVVVFRKDFDDYEWFQAVDKGIGLTRPDRNGYYLYMIPVSEIDNVCDKQAS